VGGKRGVPLPPTRSRGRTPPAQRRNGVSATRGAASSAPAAVRVGKEVSKVVAADKAVDAGKPRTEPRSICTESAFEKKP